MYGSLSEKTRKIVLEKNELLVIYHLSNAARLQAGNANLPILIENLFCGGKREWKSVLHA